MEMVDLFHKEGIGVIMDFVPVHFISDTYALNKFDGTALYEYADEDKGYSEWGTCNFNYYRGEVRSFLQSSANFWMEKFHFDGIRMDAISNAIYWQGDSSKGINEGALDFIKCMNSGLQKLHPSVMLRKRKKFNVRIAHFLYIRNKLSCKFIIMIPAVLLICFILSP